MTSQSAPTPTTNNVTCSMSKLCLLASPPPSTLPPTGCCPHSHDYIWQLKSMRPSASALPHAIKGMCHQTLWQTYHLASIQAWMTPCGPPPPHLGPQALPTTLSSSTPPLSTPPLLAHHQMQCHPCPALDSAPGKTTCITSTKSVPLDMPPNSFNPVCTSLMHSHFTSIPTSHPQHLSMWIPLPSPPPPLLAPTQPQPPLHVSHLPHFHATKQLPLVSSF